MSQRPGADRLVGLGCELLRRAQLAERVTQLYCGGPDLTIAAVVGHNSPEAALSIGLETTHQDLPEALEQRLATFLRLRLRRRNLLERLDLSSRQVDVLPGLGIREALDLGVGKLQLREGRGRVLAQQSVALARRPLTTTLARKRRATNTRSSTSSNSTSPYVASLPARQSSIAASRWARPSHCSWK